MTAEIRLVIALHIYSADFKKQLISDLLKPEIPQPPTDYFSYLYNKNADSDNLNNSDIPFFFSTPIGSCPKGYDYSISYNPRIKNFAFLKLKNCSDNIFINIQPANNVIKHNLTLFRQLLFLFINHLRKKYTEYIDAISISNL